MKLPFRLGRFLARRLDPRRRASLEDSLRIRNSRWEERRASLDRRAAEHAQAAAEPAPAAAAHAAQQDKGRRRIRDVVEAVGDVLNIADGVFRLLSLLVRGILRVIGGVLDGLSIFDI